MQPRISAEALPPLPQARPEESKRVMVVENHAALDKFVMNAHFDPIRGERAKNDFRKTMLHFLKKYASEGWLPSSDRILELIARSPTLSTLVTEETRFAKGHPSLHETTTAYHLSKFVFVDGLELVASSPFCKPEYDTQAKKWTWTPSEETISEAFRDQRKAKLRRPCQRFADVAPLFTKKVWIVPTRCVGLRAPKAQRGRPPFDEPGPH